MEFLESILQTVIGLFWIILGFGALIFIHELGHFLAAKWAGIRAEGFAVGMGPILLAWRKGIGLRFGSTLKEYEKRAREHITSSADETDATDAAKELTVEELYRAGDALGLGETEYSLRWLPIGGFVKMLGQEDANPNYVSDDDRSYNNCPIGKRMIVVSAGVVMNVILAAGLFVWAFMVGVEFEAPVVGGVSTTLAAGTTRADNADELGILEVGLLPGDLVTHIDGEPAYTFADLQIASAMSRVDQSIRLTVQREGIEAPLQFTLSPEFDPRTGLRSIGVAPGRSTTLLDEKIGAAFQVELDRLGLTEQGIGFGMRLLSVNGQAVSAYEQMANIARESEGASLTTQWVHLDEQGEPIGDLVEATIPVKPQQQVLRYPELSEDGTRLVDFGLLGLTPLVKIHSVIEGGHNEGILQAGDIVLRLAELEGPRHWQFRNELQNHKDKRVEMELLRDGKTITVQAKVDRKGMLGVLPSAAEELMMIAQPFQKLAGKKLGDLPAPVTDSPVAGLQLMPRTTIESINGKPCENWEDLWIALREGTRDAFEQGGPATVALTVSHPTVGNPRETIEWNLADTDVRDLHDLTWRCALSDAPFDAIYTTRSAGGDPLKAMSMGVQETHKIIMMTYLTIDRLIRRTVGVEQLRGPVGILHIGVKIVDRGFIYMLFFLGMISVNLAVINFLPLPIVDGGLFLFLIYEKLKGKPPSLAFQNAATIVGLCLIGTIFVVTFYNDMMRLIS